MSEHITLKTVPCNFTNTRSTQNGVYAVDSVDLDQTVADSVSYGANLKNWRQIISSGGNATTDLGGVRYNVVALPSNFTARQDYPLHGNAYDQAKIQGTYFLLNPSLSFEAASTDLAFNQALTRFYSNLASVQSKFKGLVFAGELRESLNLIRNPARSLRNGISSYLNHLKRGGRIPKKDRLKFVSDTWLEYSFGWRPIISDIDKAIDAFYRSRSARPIFLMVSGKGEDINVSSSNESNVVDGSNIKIHFSIRNTVKCNVRVWGVTTSHGNGCVNSHSYGFNPVEFVPTLWELIPYSFLVDYFTNIGDIISSWSYRFIGTNWSSRTIRHSALQEVAYQSYESISNIPGSIGSLTGPVGPMAVERMQINRLRHYGLELPKFQLQVPGMGTQWVNISALAANLLSSRNTLRR